MILGRDFDMFFDKSLNTKGGNRQLKLNLCPNCRNYERK